MAGKSERKLDTRERAVVIAGGGPTGLMLAAELALARVDVVVMERRDSHDLAGLRAGGIHMRTLEVLDQRGVAERFISQGQSHAIVPFAGTTLDASDTPTRRNYFLALWQIHVERTLAAWVSLRPRPWTSAAWTPHARSRSRYGGGAAARVQQAARRAAGVPELRGARRVRHRAMGGPCSTHRRSVCGVWELPVLGAVPAPAAVLIRPDGYVAWVGAGSEQGLREALTNWFGPP